ncbi:hypothetical protein L218DRAFT_842909, partial [Marasmius fiardii PR-910]
AIFMLPQTHFQKVLNTNYSASSSELCQIHELLVQPLEELTRINAEIIHLKSTLNYLISQREKLHNFVNSHKALVSPVRRLPAEAPLLLTLHEIRLTEMMKRRADGVKTWLSKSAALIYKPVMDVLFSFCHKWGTLMLRVPSSLLRVIEDFARPHWQDLTRLRTLTIDYDMASRQLLLLDPTALHPSPDDTDVPLAGLICNAPALRHLTLLEPIQNVYKLDLDWTKLTHFKAET